MVDKGVRPLAEIFETLEDPRDERGQRYPLVACLLLVVSGLLCGCLNPNQIAHWGRQQQREFLQALGFKRGLAACRRILDPIQVYMIHYRRLLALKSVE
jgi:hypothetical protein